MEAIIFDLFETLMTEWIGEKYTQRNLAADLGISFEKVSEVMNALRTERYIGKCSYEDAILKACQICNKIPSSKKITEILNKRIDLKASCFANTNPGVESMLTVLKARHYKLGIVSNCSSEEVTVLRSSKLFVYFDAVILSYEVGYIKPDANIYRLCTKALQVNPEDCLFVGDGGSQELWGAQAIGMTPLRAMWFLNQWAPKVESMPFDEAASPLDVIGYLDTLPIGDPQ